MTPFFSRCPETAVRETRELYLPPSEDASADDASPQGRFLLVEWYCENPKCDCRRVLLGVCRDVPKVNPDETVLMINFGWESPEFYMRWRKGDPTDPRDVEFAREMAGATVDSFAGPRPDAEGMQLFEIVKRFVLSDLTYVARLARHYAEFRAKVKPPSASLPWNLRRKSKRLR